MEITLRIECPALTELNSILRDVIGVAAGGALPGMDAPAQALEQAARSGMKTMDFSSTAPKAAAPETAAADNDGAAIEVEKAPAGEHPAPSPAAAPAAPTVEPAANDVAAPRVGTIAPEDQPDSGADPEPRFKTLDELKDYCMPMLRGLTFEAPMTGAKFVADLCKQFGVASFPKLAPKDFDAYADAFTTAVKMHAQG